MVDSHYGPMKLAVFLGALPEEYLFLDPAWIVGDGPFFLIRQEELDVYRFYSVHSDKCLGHVRKKDLHITFRLVNDRLYNLIK